MPSSTKQKKSRPAQRERNRRRAKDLEPSKLREVKRAFDIHRNSLEVGQSFLLPRAEAVDGILMQLDDRINDVRSRLEELRRQVGIGDESGRGPVLVRRVAA